MMLANLPMDLGFDPFAIHAVRPRCPWQPCAGQAIIERLGDKAKISCETCDRWAIVTRAGNRPPSPPRPEETSATPDHVKIAARDWRRPEFPVDPLSDIPRPTSDDVPPPAAPAPLPSELAEISTKAPEPTVPASIDHGPAETPSEVCSMPKSSTSSKCLCGCGREAKSRGLSSACYQRWIKAGKPADIASWIDNSSPIEPKKRGGKRKAAAERKMPENSLAAANATLPTPHRFETIEFHRCGNFMVSKFRGQAIVIDDQSWRGVVAVADE